MHKGELWQAYSLSGIPLKDGGYDSALDNPSMGSDFAVGAVDVWLYRRTENGIEVLFQHRSEFVHNANKWDISAAGHMNYSETITEAAIREAREEIGIEIKESDLRYLFSLYGMQRSLINNYFICDWTGREDDFHFDDREVSEVKWVPLSEFTSFIDKNAKEPLRVAKTAMELSKIYLEKIGGNYKSPR